MSFDKIVEDFSVLDDWEDRYRYIIELGRRMPPFPDAARNDTTRVRGCASQVWITSQVETGGGVTRLTFAGDSDALIVRGLIALLLELYNGRTAQEILSVDARGRMTELGLDTHLSQQRSNGLHAMIERIRNHAAAATT